MRTFLIHILLLFLFNTNLHSRDNLKFHTLTPKGGLSYDGILDIKQDGQGFMWILLEDNIFRFDGYTYKTYKSAFEVNNKGRFNNIICDSKGDLYLSTTQGVYKFNFLTETFELLVDIPNNYVYADKNNKIWIIHSGNISYIEDDSLTTLEFSGRKLALNSKMIAESGNDIFFFSNFGQIYIYNKDNNQIDSFDNVNTLFENSSLIQAQVKDNDLWMITSNLIIIKIDLATHRVIEKKQYDISDIKGIKCGLISKDNKVWIGNMNGLVILDPKTEEIEIHQNKQDNKFSIPHSSVWTISEDNYNNIWIGTYAGSVAYINQFEENIFTTYGLSANGLMKTPVSGFAVDKDNVWISTEGGGVNVLNRTNNTFSYLTEHHDKNSISGNYTKPPVIDKDGIIWIPTFRAGLNMYNPNTKKFTQLKSASNDSTSLLSNDLRTITLESDSGLWIVYQRHSPRISYLSFDNLHISHYSPEIDIPNLDFSFDDYIYDLYRDKGNKLWLISSNQLLSLDVTTKRFERYYIPTTKRVSASTLCIDNDGIIWIGTFGNELISFDPKTENFINYPNIIPSEIVEIYSINWADDDIWMGANDGLYVFNKKLKQCSVFKESDGTQGDVYYRLSTYKSEDNKLYFGGTGGFTIADIQRISINPIKPNTFISEFYLDYKPIYNNSDLNISIDVSTPTIKLNHNEQNFGFKIANDNYLNTDKNLFKYRLRNYDKQWISTDAQNRIIHYSKIPSGTYFFEFQSTNNDGVWGNISSIKIIRKSAPWASIPAWILYFIVFASLLYYFISSYRNKKKLENKLYLDQIEKEKREEIHKNQFLFFTNVSHDLKTPLALIMATINKMREEGMKEYYYKILNNNSQRLMLLLNDILDFRNLQKNNVKLSVSSNNLNKFINKIAADFNELAKNKNFNYIVNLNVDKLNNVPFDKIIMEKIVLNLLHNAFKYTEDNGSITIMATTDNFKSKHSPSHTINQYNEFNNQNSYKIIVSDTGVGISEESISKVFDRFYKVDTKNENKHLGTGIGLALVKELIAIHRANITICSERDKGTDFIIQFSSNIDYYKDEELTQKDESNSITNTELLNEVIIIPEDVNIDYTTDNNKEDISIDKTKTILIAEDNNDLRELLKSSLSSHYNIIDFENAKLALDYLKSKDADMIISDIMMPEIDGITFCKNVKSNIETSHIPFILLTAKSGLESQLEGTESGADLYFEKPTDLNLLKAAMSNIFKQQEILRNHYASNYFADVSEIATNREDNRFLNDVTNIIESYLDKSQLDVNTIANEMMMSRSKLYSKIKALTGKSIVEFILSYRLRKAAKLMTENNITVQEAMYSVGIERQYLTKCVSINPLVKRLAF